MVNKRPGRPAGESQARARLIAVARAHVAAGDFAAVTNRRIAEEAQVSHSLVNYHFGSRNGLLTAVFMLRASPHELLARATTPSGELRLSVLFRLLVTVWEHPITSAQLRELAMQYASGSGQSSVIGEYLHSAVFGELSAALGRVRARRVATVIVGTIFTRYVFALPEMTALSPDELVDQMLSMSR